MPIVERMLSGHQRFMAGYFEREKALFRGLAEASDQPCLALVVACSDSRVVPELIVDARPGDIVLVRTVANIVPPRGSAASSAGAAIEYARGHLPDLKHVIVWGHYGCGGVKALLEGTDALEKRPNRRAKSIASVAC